MRTLRHFTIIARLVLAWFVLSLGVAVASPLFTPKNIHQICTGVGTVMVVDADDGSSSQVQVKAMECPLCASLAAPPPVPSLNAEPAQPLAYALQAIPAAHIAARTAAPLPARGPPAV